MLTAEARIETGRPSRYLTQLCQHAAQVGRMFDSARPAGDGEPHGLPAGDPRHTLDVTAEWSETRGVINFGPGRCVVLATPGVLTLRAEAADEDSLRLIQHLLADDLRRFGRRDELAVDWQPALPAPPQPGSTF